MRLAFAVLALLCLSSVHATGIPKLDIQKTNDGVKSPEVTVKLPAVSVEIPKIDVSGVIDAIPKPQIPQVRLPKIDMPSMPSINVQKPTVDVQELVNLALSKPMPSFNLTNLAALLQKPSVDLSALAAFLQKPSVSINMPQINKPELNITALTSLLQAAIPSMQAPTGYDINGLINLITAMKANKPSFNMSNVDLRMPKPAMPTLASLDISTPQFDLSPLINLLTKKPMPQISLDTADIEALTKLFEKQPDIQISMPVVSALLNALLNKQHGFNLTMPSMPQVDLPNIFSKANLSIPEMTAALSLEKPDMSALVGVLNQLLQKPDIKLPEVDMSGLQALVSALASKPQFNMTMPSLPNIDISALLAKPSADLTAVTGAINAILAMKPNISLPDLSALLTKPSLNLNINVPDVAAHLMNKASFNLTDIALLNAVLNKPGASVSMPDLALLQAALNTPKQIANTVATVANITSMVLRDNLEDNNILGLLQQSADLHTASTKTMPSGQIVINLNKGPAVEAAAQQVSSGVNSAVKAAGQAKSQATKHMQGQVNGAMKAAGQVQKQVQEQANKAMNKQP